jgi:autotransporter-associated beta strand protein
VIPSTVVVAFGASVTLYLNGYPQTISSLSASSSYPNATVNVGGTTLTLSNGRSTFAGIIAGNGGLVKQGTSTETLTGTASTFAGQTVIQAGTISIASVKSVGGGASSLGAPTTVANGTIPIGSDTNSAGLTYTGAGNTSDRVIDLAGTTGGATLTASGTGALVLTSDLTASGVGNKTLTLGGTSTATNTIQGKIVDNSPGNTTSLTKSGAGTWVLGAANPFTGNTTISGGTLVVNGSLASPNVTVSGGTLGGTGPILGAVTVNSGGSIGAGSSAGTLTLANGLNLSPGGTNVWELVAAKDNNDGTPGTDWDQLALTTGGELNLSGSSRLLLKFPTTNAVPPYSTEPFWQANHTWTIVSLTAPAANTANAAFATIPNGLFNAGFFSNYVATGGNIILTYTTNPPSAPIITAQPQSQTVQQSSNVTFTVTAFGTDPLLYQWYFPDLSTPIPGATTNTFTITGVQPTDAGNYYVVVENIYSPPATSMAAVLTVTLAYACSQTNSIQSIINNDNGTFTLNFLGTPTAQYSVVTHTNVQETLANWTAVAGSATNAPADGLWSITVNNSGERRFYRAKAASPCP